MKFGRQDVSHLHFLMKTLLSLLLMENKELWQTKCKLTVIPSLTLNSLFIFKFHVYNIVFQLLYSLLCAHHGKFNFHPSLCSWPPLPILPSPMSLSPWWPLLFSLYLCSFLFGLVVYFILFFWLFILFYFFIFLIWVFILFYFWLFILFYFFIFLIWVKTYSICLFPSDLFHLA